MSEQGAVRPCWDILPEEQLASGEDFFVTGVRIDPCWLDDPQADMAQFRMSPVRNQPRFHSRRSRRSREKNYIGRARVYLATVSSPYDLRVGQAIRGNNPFYYEDILHTLEQLGYERK